MTLTDPARTIDEALIRAALDEVSVGVAILDGDLRFRYVNPALAAINGSPVAAHLGRPIGEIIPDVEPGLIPAIAEVVSTGRPIVDRLVTGRTAARPAGGAWLATYRPLRDEGGAIVGLLASVQDVTEVRYAEAALDQERADAAVLAALTRDVLEESDEVAISRAIVEVAVEQLRAHLGAVYLTTAGMAAVELVATAGNLPAETAAVRSIRLDAADPIAEAVRGGLVIVVDDPGDSGYPADAAFRDLRGDRAMVVVPLRVPGGAIGALVMTLDPGPRLDASLVRVRTFANVAAASVARARATRADRLTRTLLEAAIAQMPLGVAISDVPGRLIVSNPALATIWGEQPRSGALELHGEWAGFHPGGRRYERHEWPLTRSLESGETVVEETIDIVRFDGRRGSISVSSAPIHDADGALLAAVAVTTDITERREREGARDAFLGVLAHELRTPLTTIVGSARLLGRASLEGAVRDTLAADIGAEAERMAAVVENLLVLSRFERGIAMSVDEPVLVQRVVPRILTSEQAIYPAIRFDADLGVDLPPVRGEDSLLGQVLRNLVSNAAKYGGGEVRVAAERFEGGVRMIVTDDGPGVDPADVPYLFDLFYRSPRTRTIAPGAGIGLFVVRRLVQAMGGEVYPEPAERGARFVVLLRGYGSSG
ncbi:MAG TPA: PAS domain-containing protein [Candidatus Dormibacteraeota bacterium]|nr:PAS domain-containing protein [Candidatus Dormibacteraeota bacterium]